MNERNLLSAVLVTVICSVLSQFAMGGNQVLELVGDPDSFFEVPDSDSLDVDLEVFTLEAWVKAEVLDRENLVVNKEDSYEFAVVNGMYDTAVRPQDQAWKWHYSGFEVPIDEWTHLAMTWDGEIINMFMDGEWVAESFLEGDGVNDSPDTLKVGRRTRGDETNSSFEGLVDEVRLSNIIRYEAEESFPLPTTAYSSDEHTVALYHFDAVENGIIKDASSFGNDGVLRGDAQLIPDSFLSAGIIGDFNKNEILDAPDIDLLSAAIRTGGDASFDLDGSGTVDSGDRDFWVKTLKLTYIGDSDLNGEFNSGDFVVVFTAGEYEDGIAGNSTWATGDWNGDTEFDSSDFVVAFTDGGYEVGPRVEAAAVPEPTSACLILVGTCVALSFRRHR